MRINLRTLYTEYTRDCFIDIPSEIFDEYIAGLTKEIADLMYEELRREEAYRIRTLRNKAYYSLEYGDSIEHQMVNVKLSIEEQYELNELSEAIYTALKRLSEKQSIRIYQNYILGMRKVDIARNEGIAESSVGMSINRGLRKLKDYLSNFV